MLWGSPFSAHWGAVEDLFKVWEESVYPDGTGARLDVELVEGAGPSYFALVVDGLVRDVVLIPEGQLVTLFAAYDPDRSSHAVSLYDLGDADSDLDFEPADQQFAFAADKAKLVEISWDVQLEAVQAWNDAGQLSSWSLTGVRRYSNCYPVGGVSTEARIDVRLSDSAGTRTVELYVGDNLVASGSRSGDGSVTLAEQNDSGLSGSVTVAYSADLDAADGAFVQLRWAEQYEIHVQDPALSFPRSADATVRDPGLANRISGRLELSAGTYEYLVRAISNTQETGTNTTAEGSVTVPGRPEPPGVPVYASGGYADTVLEFEASTTGGATYRAYDAEALDWSTNLEDIAATALAGSGTLQITLPAIAAAAGKRRVVVESVLAGVESGFRRHVTIEYDASGAVVLPRPNVPSVRLVSRDGREVTVEAIVELSEAAGVAATAELWVLAEGASIPADGAASDASVALSGSGRVQRATLSFTAAGDGLYRLLVRTETAGGVQSLNEQTIGPYALSSAAPGTPDNVSAEVIG